MFGRRIDRHLGFDQPVDAIVVLPMANSSADTNNAHRKIRSFVRRAGRLTAGQARALAELWPRWGLEPGRQSLDMTKAFGRDAPTLLEVGFGNGEALVKTAQRLSNWNCLGIEVHQPGVGHCLLAVEAAQLNNIRVFREDAMDVLRDLLVSGSLTRVHVFFPDPWPKKRHHKRRIVQAEFVALVADRLCKGGIFRLATDWQPYAEHMREVIDANSNFVSTTDEFKRPVTKFEQRGQRLGHVIEDLIYRRR